MRLRPPHRLTALAVAAALVLTACGSGDNGASAAGPTNLRVSVWTSDPAQLALFNQIAADYRAIKPDMGTITFESLPLEDYDTTLTTQVAGGNAPDIAWVGTIAPDLLAAGALAPLTDAFRATEGYDYDDILPSVATNFTKDGTLFAYPFSNSPFALYANTTLLEQAGQDTDLGELTWEDVDRIGAAVHEKTDKAGFVIRDFNFSNWISLANLWFGWGANAWSADGRTCELNSPEMVEAFTFFHDAVFESGSHPGPGTSLDFFAGDAAFTTAQVSRSSLLDGSFEYDILPLPAGPAGSYSTLGQAAMGVFSSGKNVPAATEFLAYFTNKENAAKLAQFFPPPRQSLLTGEQLAKVNTKFSAEQLDRVVVQQLPEAVATPPRSGQAEIFATARTALDPMWTADADVAGVLGNACTAMAPLLAK